MGFANSIPSGPPAEDKKFESNFDPISEAGEVSSAQPAEPRAARKFLKMRDEFFVGGAASQHRDNVDKSSHDRRLGSLEASDDLSVVQECFVGAFLLLLMFLVYLFTRRVTAPKAFGPNGTRIVRKKAPTFMRKLL